jgi:hypothetical protein
MSRRKAAARPGTLRRTLRLLWGLLMTGVLALFALSLAYREAPSSRETPAIVPAEPPETVYTVIVLNGCGRRGAAARVRDLLMEAPDLDVVETGNAEDFAYPQTLVVDLAGNPAAAQRVARVLQERLGVGVTLRHRVARPPAHVLVVLGRDLPRSP